MTSVKDVLNYVKEIENEHLEWRENCINLVASENVASPSLRKRLSSEAQNRYVNAYAPTIASNWKKFEEARWYEGLEVLEKLERYCGELLRELFDCKYADHRVLSGANAISCVFISHADLGETIMTTHESNGGHGRNWDDLALLYGRKIANFPFDDENYTIDVDKAKKDIRRIKPKLLVFGASQIPFPFPIKELVDVANEVGALCTFDGSHVMGLIAGKEFQDPLRDGAITLFGSSHKSFPGPQGGLIMSNAEDKLLNWLDDVTDPVLIDNYHQNRVAALTIAAGEMLEFGSAYAKQIVKNSKALAQSMYDLGFNVLFPQRDFTESHQVLIDVKNLKTDGNTVARSLSSMNIVFNKVPGIKDPKGTHGAIRLGTSEMTRVGMKEGDMKEIAKLLERAIIKKEDPQVIKKEAIEYKQRYKTIHYSIDNGSNAYYHP